MDNCLLYTLSMEHRFVITNEEAFEISNRLSFVEPAYFRDEYTGEKRIRLAKKSINAPELWKEEKYSTPVVGVVHRYSSLCYLPENDTRVFLEYKWTDKTSRFEIEFEGEIPQEFHDREDVSGWQILEN